MMPRPECYPLLDSRIRAAMKSYALFGFPGVVISECAAYIELLEAELLRRGMKALEEPAGAVLPGNA